MARFGPFAIAWLVLSIPTAAVAAPRIAVLPVEFEGRVPEMSRVSLSQRLVEGLAQAGFEVSAGDVLKSALPNQSCHDAACFRQVAAKLALDYLVITQVKIREKNYALRMQLVRGRDGKPAAPEERDSCELCGIQEVGEKLDRLSSSLLAKVSTARPDPARLAVQSEPLGASVTVDGRTAGETPLSLDLAPGEHEVKVVAEHYAEVQKKVILEPGVRGLLSVNLIPITVNREGMVRAVGVRRNLGWAAVAVGAAGVGSGLLLLQYVDRTKVVCPNGVGNCYRSAKLPAGLLIGGGGMAMVAGGLVLFVDWGPAVPGVPAAQARHWMVSAGGTF